MWTLIIVMLTFGDGPNGSSATHVPGFQSSKACISALHALGMEFKGARNMQCIRVCVRMDE